MAKYRFTLSHIASGEAWASVPVEHTDESAEEMRGYLNQAVKGDAIMLKFDLLNGGIVIIPREILKGCVVCFFEHTDPAPPTGAQTTEG